MRTRRIEAFTVAELLVTISLIVVLALISISVLGKATVWMNQTTCTSSLRQMGVAILAYSNDHGNRLPNVQVNTAVYGDEATMQYWRRLILPYVGLRREVANDVWNTPFICPPMRKRIVASGNRGGIASYGMNYRIENTLLTKVQRPARTVMATEAYLGANGIPSEVMSEILITRSGDGVHKKGGSASHNILYVDGHVALFENAARLALPPYGVGQEQDVWKP